MYSGKSSTAPAAQQSADRQADAASENVPAGDVERTLGGALSAQRPVHRSADRPEFTRIKADHGVREQRQRRAHALCEVS